MKNIIFNILLIFILSGCFGAVPKEYTNIKNTKVYCKTDEFTFVERCSHRDAFYHRPSTAWVGVYTNNVSIDIVNNKKVITAVWHGDNWLFFDTIIFKGKKNQILILHLKRSQEKIEKIAGYPAGSVIEKGNFKLSDEQVFMLSKILKNDTVRVRFSGKSYFDFTISGDWKNSLEYMINFEK